ncbi:hypothetical protein [Rhodococcus sp. 15-2388-1-1a]|uniref:hypothetical protein n=1 Tax=Rhodococcus sp. 15-2388-1-1a TaxID=2023142 RepID=UPI0015953555|nr:hypothetical protein [Rhodococcus sp. 15-2388-1-1a]
MGANPGMVQSVDLMTSEPTFIPPADEGQAGWVLLPDGRYGYRYENSDDVIIGKAPAGK